MSRRIVTTVLERHPLAIGYVTDYRLYVGGRLRTSHDTWVVS